MEHRKILGPTDESFLKGGAGSGNHGHSGRPGQRGGSIAGGDAGPVQNADQKMQEKLKNPANIATMEKIHGSNVGLVFITKYNDGYTKGIYKPDNGNNDRSLRRNVNFDVPPADREMAAFEIDRAIGTNLVPPTDIMNATDGEMFAVPSGKAPYDNSNRTIPGSRGMVQQFATDTRVARDVDPTEIIPTEYEKLAILDVVIGNTDRHRGNYLVSNKDNKLVAIDHNLAFSRDGGEEVSSFPVRALGERVMSHNIMEP